MESGQAVRQKKSKYSFPYVVGHSGKYFRLNKEISSGSFGKVYEAWEVDEKFPNKMGLDNEDKIIVKVIKTSST
jgi:hypothetical protein